MHRDCRVIVALDFPTAAQAMQLVARLGPGASAYKVGLQLLASEGPALVRQLVADGKSVFLDLKLYEIPHSVSSAVEVAGKLGCTMVTVHASAGSTVLRAAVAAAKPFARLQVLALTVITSMREDDLREVGVAAKVDEQVARLARLAVDAGCHGIVASAEEAQMLRALLPAPVLIVTPGIQLAGDEEHDQVRVATPDLAARAGASYVVIGRSIARADDPRAAFDMACSQFGLCS
jgi:orotidine-5'-phosphate decarboxylase